MWEVKPLWSRRPGDGGNSGWSMELQPDGQGRMGRCREGLQRLSRGSGGLFSFFSFVSSFFFSVTGFWGWLLSVISLGATGGVAMKPCECCCLTGLLEGGEMCQMCPNPPDSGE